MLQTRNGSQRRSQSPNHLLDGRVYDAVRVAVHVRVSQFGTSRRRRYRSRASGNERHTLTALLFGCCLNRVVRRSCPALASLLACLVVRSFVRLLARSLARSRSLEVEAETVAVAPAASHALLLYALWLARLSSSSHVDEDVDDDDDDEAGRGDVE